MWRAGNSEARSLANRRRKSDNPRCDWFPSAAGIPCGGNDHGGGSMQQQQLQGRQKLYDDIRSRHLSPLWEVLHSLVPKQPTTPCVPALWRYAEVRPYLMQAGALITAEEAVRRVLILENPALPGRACDHPVAVRRPATDPAGRDRAGASARAIGAALRHRRQGRVHRGRRRAHDHASRRFHHHAVVDNGTITATTVSTVRPNRSSGSTGSTSR